MKKILAAIFILSLSSFVATIFYWGSDWYYLRPGYPAAYFFLGIGIVLFVSGSFGCWSLLCRYLPKLFVLWPAISVIILFVLFPPWTKTYRLPSSNIKATMPIGYSFLLSPPEADRASGVSIDLPRLGLQCGIVFLVTGALYYTLSTIQKTKKSIDTE